jgi:hypothetical protein
VDAGQVIHRATSDLMPGQICQVSGKATVGWRDVPFSGGRLADGPLSGDPYECERRVPSEQVRDHRGGLGTADHDGVPLKQGGRLGLDLEAGDREATCPEQTAARHPDRSPAMDGLLPMPSTEG